GLLEDRDDLGLGETGLLHGTSWLGKTCQKVLLMGCLRIGEAYDKKFFWEQQTDWIEEDRPFSFYRDKIPMSVYLFVLAAFIGLIAYKYMKAGCLL
ncbi:hypothetical protein IGA88_34290, partial [Pseudomonas aeruginosa]|nr:hypothetical protein [Pseudomonas aeruginosa]